MHPNERASDGGFIGGKFRSCPACGELLRSGMNRCRFCDAPIGPTEGPATEETGSYSESTTRLTDLNVPPPQVSDIPRARADSTAPAPSARPIRQEFREFYTADAERIPREYGPQFDPRSFSWPAFLFAELWFAEKGLLAKARVHFASRFITAVLASLYIILAVWSAGKLENLSDFSTKDMVAVGIAGMLWFVAFLLTIGYSFIDATNAHRNYTDLVNTSLPEELAETRRNGVRFYWAMLYLPFSVYLIAFLIMLSTVSTG